MINLYKKDATNFENNGLGSLDQNIINPEISWVDNGAFTLEFKYPLFAKHGKEIENSSIIKCNDADGSNLFFVYKITPSMGIVHVLCYQMSYKLAFNSINDTFIVEKNGQLALNQMSNATQYQHQFKFFSDIQTLASSRVVRKNPIEFLLDTSLDNCFLNRWGGHIVRQNFNISVNTAYGSNKGYVIRHKKDLKGFEAQFDESTVITRIRPLGYDGLLLPEIYVDSNLVSSYPEPRIQQFEYSNVKVAEKAGDEGFATKELAYAELRRLAKLEFSKNKVDVPDFSAKVSFVNLKDTDEYRYLQSLKAIKTGDTVKVVHAEDGFEISAQMVEYKYNPLNNSYISITLGNYSKSFTSTVSKVSAMQEKLDKVATQSQNAWTAANGKNTVYSLSSFPQITSNSAEGDLLYLKNGDKIELWILEKVNGKLQWVLQVSDATQEELKAQIKDAQKDIADAVKSVNDAVDKANQNIKEIGELDVKLIDTKELTNKAIGDAAKAIADAKTAYNQATENTGKLVTVNQEIDKVKGSITQKVSQTDFDKSLGRITQAESSITQNANAITQKVSKTDVENILTGKAYATKSELTQTSDSLTSTISGVKVEVDKKASQTQVTQLSQDLSGFKTTVSSTNTGLTNESLITTKMMKDTTLVNPSFNTMPMVEVPVTNGETYTVSTNQPWEANAAHVFFIRATDTQPISGINGVYDGKSITLPALSDKIYIVFRNQNFLNRFINGQYWIRVSKTVIGQSQITSQIAQSATDITSSVQSWTNGRLNGYSTIKQTDDSIISAVSGVNAKFRENLISNSDFRNDGSSWGMTANANPAYNRITKNDSWYSQLPKTKPTKYIRFEYAKLDADKWIVSTISNPSDYVGTQLRFSTYYYGNSTPENGFEFYSRVTYDGKAIYFNAGTSNAYGKLGGWNRIDFLADLSKFTNPSLLTDINLSFRVKGATKSSGNVSFTGFMVTEDGNLYDWSYDYSANPSYSQIVQLNDQITSKVSVGEMNSQITQLKNDINLRIVEKGTVTSQINLESGKALISANQILLNADNVKFSGSAFIPSAFIQNLTADKINTGTLNAGNINVINLNALSITSGTLNSDRIGANSITADKIKATSLDLFSDDAYTNVRADGMRIQGKAQIVFGNWRDSSNTLRATQGVYIGGIGGGTKHMAFTRSNGSTFMLRAENGMDYGTNQNVSLNQLNIYDNVQFWESARVHGNLINEGYIAMGGGMQEASIQYDKNAATMNFRIPGGRSGSYYWFNQKVTSAGSFDSASRLSLKNVKGNYQGSALDDICKTDIVEYSYKNSPEDKQLSPIIDDVNTDKQYHLPDVITDGKTVNLYAMTSLSWLAIKELNKKIEQLEQKLKEK